MATIREIQGYVGNLAAILWNFGATFPDPTLDPYEGGAYGFAIEAVMPGDPTPKPALIKLVEVWEHSRGDQYTRVEYDYDFVEHPLNRRRAYHRHDEEDFLREFGVAVHEHCEEMLGRPACVHYFGLPLNGYEAIHRFTKIWGQPGPLDCSQLQCIG